MLITAHRGASGTAPENTILALEKAIADGADMIEFDVQPTLDGEIVLFHDNTVNRTTNGQGLLSQLSWKYLKTLDAGSWFDEDYAGERIPRLDEALDACKNRTLFNIEIKTNTFSQQFIETVIAILTKKKCENQTIITSFHKPSIQFIHSAFPYLKTGFISALPWWKRRSTLLTSPCTHMSIYHNNITPQLVSAAHRHNKEIHTWTVNKPHRMKKMLHVGVDSIITNFPALLKSITENNCTPNPDLS